MGCARCGDCLTKGIIIALLNLFLLATETGIFGITLLFNSKYDHQFWKDANYITEDLSDIKRPEKEFLTKEAIKNQIELISIILISFGSWIALSSVSVLELDSQYTVGFS